ncbi:MAG: helix-turn-helix transcriptional regulator [Planctomycetes bacterium]|nr:helix-turn-helix transcriptional regulator [Planctomycetota bacterium]
MGGTKPKRNERLPEDVDKLESIARRAPKQWRTARALQSAGFVRVPGGFRQVLRLSRMRRLARRMTTLRKRAGLSPAEVARHMGITPAALARLENQDTAEPTLKMLDLYAEAVGGDVCLSLQPADKQS